MRAILLAVVGLLLFGQVAEAGAIQSVKFSPNSFVIGMAVTVDVTVDPAAFSDAVSSLSIEDDCFFGVLTGTLQRVSPSTFSGSMFVEGNPQALGVHGFTLSTADRRTTFKSGVDFSTVPVTLVMPPVPFQDFTVNPEMVYLGKSVVATWVVNASFVPDYVEFTLFSGVSVSNIKQVATLIGNKTYSATFNIPSDFPVGWVTIKGVAGTYHPGTTFRAYQEVEAYVHGDVSPVPVLGVQSVTISPNVVRPGEKATFTVTMANSLPVNAMFIETSPVNGPAMSNSNIISKISDNVYKGTVLIPASYNPGPCNIRVVARVGGQSAPRVFYSGKDFQATLTVVKAPLSPIPAVVNIGMKAKTDKIVYSPLDSMIVTVEVENNKLNNALVTAEGVDYELYRVDTDPVTHQSNNATLLGSGYLLLFPVAQNGAKTLVIPGEASAMIAGGEIFGNINNWVGAPYSNQHPRPEGFYSMQLRFNGKKANGEVVTGVTSVGFGIEAPESAAISAASATAKGL
ncbi:MAG: hypothetical protein HQL20_10515 [Candidatus Omnitrophica bacterium]|nr:hypothetical protein [Candidatus Omnitrophota bacterium]